MSTKPKSNKTTALAHDQKAIAGVEKYFANVGKLTLLGIEYTPATLKAALQADIDAINALDANKAQLKQQVATTRIANVKTRAMQAALRKFILGAYGATAVQMLEDFGMTVPKHMGPRTAEAKAKAAAKAKATRAAHKAGISKIPVSAPASNGAASVSTSLTK